MRLEPDSYTNANSQAVSLKRIADTLEELLRHLQHFGTSPHPNNR